MSALFPSEFRCQAHAEADGVDRVEVNIIAACRAAGRRNNSQSRCLSG
jgi:hypothetical protein